MEREGANPMEVAKNGFLIILFEFVGTMMLTIF